MKQDGLESRVYGIVSVEPKCCWYALHMDTGDELHIRNQSGRSKGLSGIRDEKVEITAVNHPPLLSKDIKLILGKDNKEYYRAANYKGHPKR